MYDLCVISLPPAVKGRQDSTPDPWSLSPVFAVFQETSPACGRQACLRIRKFGVFGLRVSCLEFASLVQKEIPMRDLGLRLKSILDRYA